jgi:hypothetical protein
VKAKGITSTLDSRQWPGIHQLLGRDKIGIHKTNAMGLTNIRIKHDGSNTSYWLSFEGLTFKTMTMERTVSDNCPIKALKTWY